MKVLLIGNPNCGKTTLFNALTGSKLPVGNRPGVTVNRVNGKYRNNVIYDLPGIYSLSSPHGEEKEVTVTLQSLSPDIILNVVDVNLLPRSLYLTEQLLDFAKRNDAELIVLLNMTEEGAKKGIIIDESKLSELLGCPVISLRRNEKNFDRLFSPSETKEYKTHPQEQKVLYDIAEKIAISVTEKTDAKIGDYRKNRRTLSNRFLSENCVNTQKISHTTEKTDKLLAQKWALPLFATIFAAVFTLTVAIASFVGSLLSKGLNTISLLLTSAASPLGKAASSFLFDGVLGGIGSVLQFLPLIMAMFFLTEVAEQSGILPRAALLFDPLLAPLGLSGRSAITFFVGCGCTVPAVFSARTATTKEESLRCIRCVHLLPCSAKLPLCALVMGAFYNNYALLLPLLYLCSLLAIFVVNIFGKKKERDFLLEVPPLRLPEIRSVLSSVGNNVKSFALRICTVVFCASIGVWVLAHFDFGLHYCDIEKSILAFVGDKIKYLFYPLGLYDWKIAVAIITGFAGKETAAGTLNVLAGGDILSLFNPMSATIFILFILFSPPCAASLGAMRKELGIKAFVKTVIIQLSFAYLICSLINVGYIICSFNNLS